MNIPDSPIADDSYPDRPSHPDFARLVELILELDSGIVGKARQARNVEGGVDEVDSIIAGIVDPQSISYMALQRSLRAVLGLAGAGPVMQGATLYMEAFVMGYRFRDRYKEASSGTP